MNAGKGKGKGQRDGRIRAMAAALWVVGCGGVVAAQPNSNDAGSTPMTPMRNPDCPAALPANGAPCHVSVGCEYRKPGAPSYCTEFASCEPVEGTPSAWLVTHADPNCVVRPDVCPSVFPGGKGMSCSTSPALNCYYDDGTCDCSPSDCTTGASNWM